ncbi:prepilin-type N-terminal cleavage/methylation domain-containing protein [Deinococcus fonticola]|uniref:prepilin-type N-terminal cleavage/methylation domain-containing protein n=1 Tax=Deinococcus fonticola TaxID=2528713 RepID=UPI0010750681|nr:prepilin-type N-terminal cleavage/methylation domain-containing protein [Deinococcus fonticola]
MINQKAQGFTLIELLIVITITGILVAVLIPNLILSRNKANDVSAYAFLRHCVNSMEMLKDLQGYVVKATKCDDPLLGDAGQHLPASVKTTAINSNADSTEYNIVVTSSTGKIFKYENGQFTQGN